MTRPGRAISKPIPQQRWVTLFALLAFFLQGLAVQTHIHDRTPVARMAIALPAPAKAPPKSQDPVDQCRLCQEFMHAGVFITPSTTALSVDLNYVAAVFAAQSGAIAAPATTFAWQSRAPPRG
jgi:hypothetical protein